MAITRVWIEEGCISCNSSEENCPEVFKVKDKGATVIEGVDYSGLEEKIKQAAEACQATEDAQDTTARHSVFRAETGVWVGSRFHQ